MCGILGAVTSDKRTSNHFSKALQTLSHRGPDSEGVKAFQLNKNSVILGQKRLAIIDLNPQANQPMRDHTGHYWITFNGEIYNYQELKNDLKKKGHKFQTLSDTEVILEGYKAFGINIVDKLIGMFAFALYDAKNNTLILARDHFGKKPLYYYLTEDSLVFGSELKALLSFEQIKNAVSLDEVSMRKFLMYGYIPSPRGIYKEVKKLPAATLLEIDLNDLKVKRKRSFWNLSKVSLQHVPFNEAVEKTDSLIKESVRKRLVADVPVGTFLSGGIDSSLVTAIASQLHPEIETFSVVYEDKSVDESEYIKLVGSTLSIKHNYYYFKDSQALALLQEVLSLMDEPMADASLLPTTFIAKQTRRKVTVALSGDGGDELFGGYPKYNAQLLLENELLYLLLKAGKKGEKLIDLLPMSIVKKNIYKKLLSGVDLQSYSRHFIWGSGSFTFSELSDVLRDKTAITEEEIFSESKRFSDSFGQNDFGNRILFLDAMIQLPDWYLVKADRGSMSQSLEVRSPFLDKELAEYVMSLPSQYKFSLRTNKKLLKEVARRYLPEKVVTRQKMGFGLPLNRWLTVNFRRDVENALAYLPEDHFNRDYVSKLLDELQAGKADHGTKIWRLFILARFFQKYGKYL